MEEEKKDVVRNSQLFRKWLEDEGLSYVDVYRCLNENGINDYNGVVSKSGELIEDADSNYTGQRDFHGCDNGLRAHAEKNIDCIVGNIQEELFCLDNRDFRPNKDATHFGIKNDRDITTKKLDLIHIPTGMEVEFKVNYSKKINENYNTCIYRHRDAKFTEFMRNGGIMIIYFPYLNKVAVFDKRNFFDPEMGVNKGSVRIIKKEWDGGKLWDIVSVYSGLFMDYHMMKEGNVGISEKISRMCAK